MRLTLAGQRTTQVPAGTQVEVCEASENRVGIVFNTFPGVNGYYSLQQGTGIGFGLFLGSISNPIALNIWDHGDLVRREWFARHDSASINVANVFVLDLPPDWEKHFPEEKVEQYRRYFY